MKILVCGANGRMGGLIIKLAHEYDCEIISTVNRGTSLDTAFEKQPDVCIDFSSPDGLLTLAKHAAERGVRIISGTTGLNVGQKEILEKYSKKIPILYATNFSIGIYVLNKLVKAAAELLPEDFDVEIIERHHAGKKDAPSGTAMSLLRALQADSVNEILFGRHGESLRKKGEICVHSVRGGDIVGEHEVMFAGIGERLELIHRATNREIFARGALYVAKIFMNINTPGMYELADVL